MHTKEMAFYAILFSSVFVFLSSSIFSQEFGDLIDVSNNADRIETEPAIAVDRDNHVHIAWTGAHYNPEAPDGVAFDIFYSNNITGSFSPPVQIITPTDWYSRHPTISVDSEGNAHIAYRRSVDQMNVLSGDDIYYVTNANGNFENPVRIIDGKSSYPPTPSQVKGPRYPLIHCDSQDYVHLTLQALGLGDNYGDILLYMNNVGGDWSAPVCAGQRGTISYGDYDSHLDAQDKIHFVFANWDSVFYFHNTNGEFCDPVYASLPEHDHPMSPGIAIDSHRNAHIVYRKPFASPGTPDLFYVNNLSGSFDSWIPLCEYNIFYIPTIAVDNLDVVHIAYKKFMAHGGALYYGNNIGGDFSFITCDQMGSGWYPGSRYFVLGASNSIHFTFYDWIGGNTDIFYLTGSWQSVGVKEKQITKIPTNYQLYQNFPNPFNATTAIRYDILHSTHVELKVYNTIGGIIRTLVDEDQVPGSYEVILKADNFPSGIYFVSLNTNFCHMVKKITLIR